MRGAPALVSRRRANSRSLLAEHEQATREEMHATTGAPAPSGRTRSGARRRAGGGVGDEF